MFPRVVATDLDGTLLRGDGTLDERTRAALTAIEDTGALIVLCTARPARWLGPLAAACGRHGLAVCANGGVIYDVHAETVVQQFPMEVPVALEVVARLGPELPGGVWAVERADQFGREPAYTPRWPVPEDTLVASIESLLSHPPVKLMFRHPEMAVAELVRRSLALVGHLVEITYSSSEDALLEISAAGISKASGLAALCAERGISSAEVMAFGDMPNDLPMLAWAGHGVAVANAHPDVLAAADEVTATNDECGVARVLERILAGDTIITLLRQRDPGKTICPSDAARALAGDRFRPLMQPVRDAAIELADEGRIQVTQRGDVIDPRTARGPIRYRLSCDDN